MNNTQLIVHRTTRLLLLGVAALLMHGCNATGSQGADTGDGPASASEPDRTPYSPASPGIFVVNSESDQPDACLLYTSPSPRDRQKSRMPSSA